MKKYSFESIQKALKESGLKLKDYLESIRTTCPHCVESHLKQNHLENRDETMVKLWKLVKKDRRNDRKKQTV